MNPAAIVASLVELGFRVVVSGDAAELVPTVDGAAVPGRLMASLKANRAAVIEYVRANPDACRVCRREVVGEDRERLAGVNPFCTEGGSTEVVDGTGTVHSATKRCPYKGSTSR